MEPTKDQIYNAFRKQPEQVRKYIVSLDAADDIAKLGATKSLSDEQVSKLAKQSGFYLMKLVPEDALAGNIAYELDVEDSLSETLAAYIKDVIKPKSEHYVEPEEPEAEEETEDESEEVTRADPEPVQEVQPAIHEPIFTPSPKPEPIAETKPIIEEKPAPVAPQPVPLKRIIETPAPVEQKPVEVAPRQVPINRIIQEKPAPTPVPEPIVVPEPIKAAPIVEEHSPAVYKLDATVEPTPAPVHIDDNLPAIIHPEERELTIRTAPPVQTAPVAAPTPIPQPEIKTAPVAPAPQSVEINPTAPKVSRASIIDAKLHGTIAMPKQEVDVTPPNERPKPKYDPYREPVE